MKTNRLTLFYTPPKPEQIAKDKHFVQVCEDVACVNNLKRMSSQEMSEWSERATADFERLMREVDER